MKTLRLLALLVVVAGVAGCGTRESIREHINPIPALVGYSATEWVDAGGYRIADEPGHSHYQRACYVFNEKLNKWELALITGGPCFSAGGPGYLSEGSRTNMMWPCRHDWIIRGLMLAVIWLVLLVVGLSIVTRANGGK